MRPGETLRTDLTPEKMSYVLGAKRSDPRPGAEQAQVTQPAPHPKRQELLDKCSHLLTKPEPFTVADLFSFADAMGKVAGEHRLGNDETVVVVPDIVPETGVAKISLHEKITEEGPSLNIVFQGAHGNQDSRYVYGEDFSRGTNHTTRARIDNLNGRAHRYSPRTDTNGEIFDIETTGREICNEVFVRHLVNAGRISPDQAAEAIQKGTSVEELVGAK